MNKTTLRYKEVRLYSETKTHNIAARLRDTFQRFNLAPNKKVFKAGEYFILKMEEEIHAKYQF